MFRSDAVCEHSHWASAQPTTAEPLWCAGAWWPSSGQPGQHGSSFDGASAHMAANPVWLTAMAASRRNVSRRAWRPSRLIGQMLPHSLPAHYGYWADSHCSDGHTVIDLTSPSVPSTLATPYCGRGEGRILIVGLFLVEGAPTQGFYQSRVVRPW